MQCSDGDEARIDLEEVAERRASLATAEAIGAECGNAAWRPFVNHGGQDFQVVAGGDKDALLVLEALRDIGNARRLIGVQPVPTFALNGVGIQALVAGNAPNVSGNTVILFENI